MSKGLSKIQKTILGLLEGTEKGRIFACHGGSLLTSELVDELVDRGLLKEDAPRKQLMFTVVRACGSLVHRGLLEGIYESDEWGRHTISWEASKKKQKK